MTATTRHDEAVDRLRDLLARDGTLRGRLERSLVLARERAEQGLDADLFAALEWPQDLEGYERYLAGFLRWIPQQTGSAAWRNSSPQGDCAKEVSDRLAHFYFLVDQSDSGDAETSPAIVQNDDAFRQWLTKFARRWGDFLDTPESFGPRILDSFLEHAPEYRVQDSLIDGRPNMPSGWRTFNQFFARQLNAGLRPVAEPADNRVVTSGADCFYQQWYGIDGESAIPATRLKGTHGYGHITSLLEGSRYAGTFAGGTFVHYMLPPSAYHRFHAPVSGRVEEAFVVQGAAFLQVDLADGELTSRDSATTGYEFTQTRGVLTVDTTGDPAGDVGIVGVVPVGMSQVASVVLTATVGKDVAKGEEFGYFQFGGSDIILLFQAGVDPEVDESAGFRHYGTPVARAGAPSRP